MKTKIKVENKKNLIDFANKNLGILTLIGIFSAVFMYFTQLSRELIILRYGPILIYFLLFILSSFILKEAFDEKKRYDNPTKIFCSILFIAIFLLFNYINLKFWQELNVILNAIIFFGVSILGFLLILKILDEFEKWDRVNENKSFWVSFLCLILFIILIFKTKLIDNLTAKSDLHKILFLMVLFLLFIISSKFIFRYLPHQLKKIFKEGKFKLLGKKIEELKRRALRKKK